MPELPEVETTLRGILPYVKGQLIQSVDVRHSGLRIKINKNINDLVSDQTIESLERRGKYLLFHLAKGTLILHLGMSGRLRILTTKLPPAKHDHFDIQFSNGNILRYTDPRRFGIFLWTDEAPHEHFLLKHLGPEPLTKNFSGKYLFERSRRRKVSIKSFIMDSKIVVGVGNIYAAEALFAAGVHPELPAGKISQKQSDILVKEIKKILRVAIKKGGTTFRDFLNSEGKPGYFSMHLNVYGRKGEPCVKCKNKLKEIKLGQRSTVFCPKCQVR